MLPHLHHLSCRIICHNASQLLHRLLFCSTSFYHELPCSLSACTTSRLVHVFCSARDNFTSRPSAISGCAFSFQLAYHFHRGTYLRTTHRKQTDGYLGLVMWCMQHQSSWPPQSHNSMMTLPVRRLTFCAFLRKLIWYTLPQDCFCSIHLSCDCTVSCNR